MNNSNNLIKFMQSLSNQKNRWINIDVKDILAHFWASVLAFFAFAPTHLSILTWLAPMGIFFILEKHQGKYKVLLVHGFILAVIFNGISFYWEVHMMTVFGGFPLLLSIPMFLLSGIFLNLKFPFFMLLFAFISNNSKINKAILAGAVMTLAELVTYQIFPWYWGNLGAGHQFISQLIEIIGIYGLTFVVFLISYLLFQVINDFFKTDEAFSINHPAAKNLLILFVLIIIINGGGYFIFKKWEAVKPVAEKNILIIQPDSPLEFRDGTFRDSMIELMLRIEKLTADGAKMIEPDLIVLPESGVPFFSAHNSVATTLIRPSYWDRFESMITLFALKYKANVFFNEIDAAFKNDIPSAENHVLYNNAALYDPNAQRRESYRKSYLLVFGEYMPFEFLYALSPQTARFEPGKKQNLISYYSSNQLTKNPTSSPIIKDLNWNDTEKIKLDDIYKHYKSKETVLKEDGKFLPLICYEVIIPEFVRKFSQNGDPDFIVNITNDKWYGKSVETFQHLDLARIRSIEYRRWMVRSTSSGTSAVVDHLGRIVDDKFTGQETAEFYAAKLQVIKGEKTFYLLYGNLIPWLLVCMSGVLAVVMVNRKGNSKTT